MNKYNIPPELLAKYVLIVSSMQKCIFCGNVSALKCLEKSRREIHDEILEACKVTRDDDSFTLFFANIIEEILEG